LSENSYLYSLLLNTAWKKAKTILLSTRRAELESELAVATKEVGAYEKQLTAHLIDKMYRLCETNSVIFIIVDIPQTSQPSDFKSSIPDDLLNEFRRSSHALIRSEDVLSQYRGLVEFHVTHGARHISEFSHMMLGIAAARSVQGLLGLKDGGGRMEAASSSRQATMPDAP
jgi:hypothetical protein